MTRHLSSQQILEWMNGERAVEAEQHVRDCAECGQRVDRLRESLELFRGSVRETAENNFEARSEGQTVLRMPRRRTALRWLTAAAAVILLAGLPIFKVQEDRQRAAEVARQDAELMREVDAELSSEVAAPLKPLEKMVSWGTGSAAQVDKRRFQ
jgi:hypothetical protein